MLVGALLKAVLMLLIFRRSTLLGAFRGRSLRSGEPDCFLTLGCVLVFDRDRVFDLVLLFAIGGSPCLWLAGTLVTAGFSTSITSTQS